MKMKLKNSPNKKVWALVDQNDEYQIVIDKDGHKKSMIFTSAEKAEGFMNLIKSSPAYSGKGYQLVVLRESHRIIL